MARFTLPRDLYHGKGSLEALKTFQGKKAIICVGGGSMKKFGFLDRAIGYLKEAGMEVDLIEGIEPDPSVDTVMKGAAKMIEFQPDWIIAMGGGSPIDAAKAMWIKYEYPDTTFEDMCKVFGLPRLRTKAHFCAISSTSGTATEVTAFSIITDYNKGIKYPIADFEITPDVAIVDPDLAETMPQKLVAHTGMDAMTHAIEGLITKGAWELSDMFEIKAIEMIHRYLPIAVEEPTNPEGRNGMAVAQYVAGMAFSNVGLGVDHGMAHPLSALHDVPHGVACAMLLPTVMRWNAPAALDKYVDIAKAVGVYRDGMTREEAADAACDEIANLSRRVGIPAHLSELGITEKDIDALADQAIADVCTPGNPRPVTREDIVALYRQIL